MYLEMYCKNHLKKPICSRFYKTYRGALNHILKECKKPLNTNYKKLLADNTIYVIRDDLNRIICNCVYNNENGKYLITETDNIGRIEKQTFIEAVKNEEK